MKISVIIPVYNAEKHIRRCIDSVLKQSYNNWQMILVDDGSKDQSLEICLEYANMDNRIHVIHQENKGAGAARNVGITHASGEYVVFIDSDDYIEKDYFLLLSTHDEDIVFIDVQNVSDDGKVIRKDFMSCNSNLSKDTILRRQMTGCIHWGGVRKSVKLVLLKEYNIKYTSHKIGEEALYSFEILYYANNFGFICSPLYNYVQREDSLSHSKVDDPWGGAAISIKEKIIELGIYEDYADSVNAFLLSAAAVSSKCLANNYSFSDYLNHICECRNNVISKLDQSYQIDKKNMNLKAKLIGELLLKGQYFVIWILVKISSLKIIL